MKSDGQLSQNSDCGTRDDNCGKDIHAVFHAYSQILPDKHHSRERSCCQLCNDSTKTFSLWKRH